VAGLQLSAVQSLPSSQALFCGAWTQALAVVLQLSAVQSIPSLQLGGVPDWQPVALQVSAPLQKLPSSQALFWGVWTQALAVVLQLSAVQAIPSSQLGGMPGRHPRVGLQVSAPLQKLLSLQALFWGVWTQALAVVLQLSAVQSIPSLQLGGVPDWQPVALQVSAPLQKLPSSQALFCGVWTQALAVVLQLSAVQATPSSQLGGVPGRQPAVALQVSAPLQKLPSSQALFCGVWTQALAVVLQLSAVQRIASSQLGGMPGRHPTVALQVSAPLQKLPSSQLGAVPGWQTPLTQVSTPLQAFPSLQSAFVAQP
jgi:uncharacterized membrane protein